MDRISFIQHTQPAPSPAMLRETKPIDPTPRLRIADRSDRVELSDLSTRSAAAQSLERLIAGRVTEPVKPAPVSAQASRALRFYTDPTDQNAAATLGAGSSLDVLA